MITSSRTVRHEGTGAPTHLLRYVKVARCRCRFEQVVVGDTKSSSQLRTAVNVSSANASKERGRVEVDSSLRQTTSVSTVAPFSSSR